MNEFLSAIKVDLLDRRRRPMLILAVAALVGAIAYAVIASGSSSSSAGSLGPEPTLGNTGLPVSQAAPNNGDQAVAETTSGTAKQHGGNSRNPFTPLPGTFVAPTKSNTSSTSSTTSSSSSSSSPSSSGGGASGGSSPASTHHAKVKVSYRVSVLFGRAGKGELPAEAKLTPYENLKLNQLLPSKEQPLLAFRGVVVSPHGDFRAAFTLVGELIPRGPGICKPSAVDCRVVELGVGQAEELEMLAPNGEVLNYDLEPASIVTYVRAKAAAASRRRDDAIVSRYGSWFLRRVGLLALPGLRYFSGTDALYAPARAHAHTAAHRSR
jgi:hypothetical protein